MKNATVTPTAMARTYNPRIIDEENRMFGDLVVL